MRFSGWQSRFWQRYRPGGGASGGTHAAGSGSSGSSGSGGGGPRRSLYEELKDGTAYLLKGMAVIYLVREYLVEFMVVSSGAESGEPAGLVRRADWRAYFVL